eukprot:2651902-Rhodomonas_salina.2
MVREIVYHVRMKTLALQYWELCTAGVGTYQRCAPPHTRSTGSAPDSEMPKVSTAHGVASA